MISTNPVVANAIAARKSVAINSRPDIKAKLHAVSGTLVGIINIFKRGLADDVTPSETKAVAELEKANSLVNGGIGVF